MSVRTTSRWLLAALAITAVSLPTVAQAQESGSVSIKINSGEGAQIGYPVMVSCIKDGAVFYQSEAQIGYNAYCRLGGETQLPVGTYDVRAEGGELVTEAKRGILVTAGNDTGLTFIMKSGEGIHVVEYATGGLAREEVAVRLRDLEAKRAEQESLIAELEARIKELEGGTP
jgi:hypothetical protein